MVRDRRPFALLAERDGCVVGCLTGWHLGSKTVSGMLTHPQIVVLDVPDRDEVERALARALLQEARRSSFVSLYSWGELRSLEALGFRRRCTATCVIDLSVTEDVLLRQLDTKKRRNIKTAVKHGVEIREASEADVDEFHDVLKATHQRLGLPAPLSPSELLTPRTNRRLFVARHAGRCIAGTIVRYRTGGLAEYSENASLPEHWSLRPNDLLLWHGVRWAKGIGCRWFNSGGDNAFKREFGGTPVPVYRLSIDKSWFRRHDGREWLESEARRLYRAIRRRASRAA
jgi:hypothetical protein